MAGKVTIDFKDAEALRALTTTLLKKDFDLGVDMPLDKMIPTVPLRLNYILWIEDLLSILGPGHSIHGVDIGTGASCIYCLLAAKSKGWNMVATEIDETSTKFAKANVERNSLSGLIEGMEIKHMARIRNCKMSKKYCVCIFTSW